MTEDKVRPDFERIEAEHGQIRTSIEGLRAFLEQPRPPIGEPGYHTWASHLAEMLTKFHDQVFRHFREEERSGFLEELERRYPHASHKIDLLRREHDRILGEIRSVLAATLVYGEGKTPENPALRRWTLSILDRIGEHEHDETELMARLLYTDLGQVD